MPLNQDATPEWEVPKMWTAFGHRGVTIQRRPIGWCVLRPSNRRARTIFSPEQGLTKAEARVAYDAWMATPQERMAMVYGKPSGFTEGRVSMPGPNLMQVPNLNKRCRMIAFNAMKGMFP